MSVSENECEGASAVCVYGCGCIPCASVCVRACVRVFLICVYSLSLSAKEKNEKK